MQAICDRQPWASGWVTRWPCILEARMELACWGCNAVASWKEERWGKGDCWGERHRNTALSGPLERGGTQWHFQAYGLTPAQVNGHQGTWWAAVMNPDFRGGQAEKWLWGMLGSHAGGEKSRLSLNDFWDLNFCRETTKGEACECFIV